MAHTIVKFNVSVIEGSKEFLKKYSTGKVSMENMTYDDAKSWHLVSPLDSGENTVCGQVYSDYSVDVKTMGSGGITCNNCLKTIKYLKSIKL